MFRIEPHTKGELHFILPIPLVDKHFGAVISQAMAVW